MNWLRPVQDRFSAARLGRPSSPGCNGLLAIIFPGCEAELPPLLPCALGGGFFGGTGWKRREKRRRFCRYKLSRFASFV